MEGSCNDPIFLWILVTDCPFQRSVGHVTCSVIPSGIVSIGNYTEFKSGCFELFVFLLLGLNNFEIQLPIHLIRLQLGSWNIIVQVQQQLLYDFMISSAFPFLALNFTPVSMACHRHTCTPCPCRHTGLASGGMVWAGLSISSWSSLIRVCYECHVQLGFSTSPRDFSDAVSPPTFLTGKPTKFIAFWGLTNRETMLYSWLGTLRNGFWGGLSKWLEVG